MFDACSQYINVDVVCCQNVVISETEDTNLWEPFNNDIKVLSGKDAIVKLFSDDLESLNPFWCKLIRKKVLFDFDYIKYKSDFPLCYFEDGFVIPLLYMRADNILMLSNKLYAYRIVNNSLSHSTLNTKYFINQVRTTLVLYDVLGKYDYGVQKKCYEGLMLGIMKSYYCSLKEGSIRNHRAVS